MSESGPAGKKLTAWRRRLAESPHEDVEIAAEIMATPRLTPGDWAVTWERLLAGSQLHRKHSGSFYTPETWVNAALARAFEFMTPDPERGEFSILDPAAGTGNFLVGAAKAFAAWRARCGCAAGRLRLIAADQDAGALAIARRRLALSAPAAAVEILKLDALESAERLPAVDLVAGNPPFVSLRMLSSEQRRRLENRFRFARGRFNLFTLFMECAFTRWLLPNGVGCLVVPDRLLRNVQLKAFRDFMISESTLLALDDAPEGCRFAGATVDCVAVVWRNARPGAENYQFRAGTRSLSAAGFPENLFSPSRTLRSPYPWRTLGAVAEVRDGIIQGKIGDRLFLKRAATPECRKLLRGSDVSCDRIVFHENYVDFQPAVMKQLELERGGGGLRLRNPAIFERPKILTRQTADRIIAAFDARGEFYYANTLHGITVTTPEVDAEYLMLWLNSELLNDCYRRRSGETGRVFAQIKIAILRELPVPVPPVAEQRNQVSEYRRLTAAGRDEAVALGVIFADFDGGITSVVSQ